MTKKRLFERVVGALLVSAFCFILYSIFLDSETQNYIDRSTQIPRMPEFIEPLEIETVQIVIAEPEKESRAIFIPTKEVSPQQALESQVLENQLHEGDLGNELLVAENQSSGNSGSVDTQIEEIPEVNQRAASPNAWVIQVGSFSGAEKANQVVDQLLLESYKAYQRSLDRDDLYRVLVGPYIDAEQAVRDQRQVDSMLGLSTLLMKFEP